MKKTRADAFENAKLSPEQEADLEKWLFEETPKATYDVAVARAQERWGIKISTGAMGNFWQRKRMAREGDKFFLRLHKARKASEAYGPELRKFAPEMEENAWLAAQQLAFEISTDEEPDPKKLAELLKVLTARKAEERSGAALAFERQKHQTDTLEKFLKFAEDKKAQEILASGSSKADQLQQLGQLMFGEDYLGNPA